MGTLTTGQTSLTESLNNFQKDVGNALKAQQQESSRALQDLVGKISKPADDDKSRQPPSYEESDLETMPRKEFMSVIIAEISDSLKPQFETLNEKITSGKEETAKDRIQREYNDLMSGDAPDIDEWRDELRIEAKKNPLLSVRDAYLLARASNADKAKELDEKITKGLEEDAAKKRGSDQEGGFGGMRPGSGEKSEQRSDMNNKDSSEKAWDDIFGGREGELLLGEVPTTADNKAA